jgi:dihydroflavonol-4-reductase
MLLVTGANGHIGSHIVRELLENGYGVRGLLRPGSDRRGLTDIMNEPLGSSFETFHGDVLERPTLARAMDGCEGVIHSAALFSSDPSRKKDILKIAVQGSLNVMEATLQAGVKKVVHISSTAAVGSSSNTFTYLDETSWEEDPPTAYTNAKKISELAVTEFASKSGLPLVVACPSTVIGRNDFKMTPSNSFLRLLAMRKNFFYFAGGINLISAYDAAMGIRLAYEKGLPGERYILANKNLTFREIAKMADKLCGRKKARVPMPTGCLLAGGMALDLLSKLTGRQRALSKKSIGGFFGRYHYFTNQKAVTHLGFDPGSPEDALRNALEWVLPEECPCIP